MTPRPPRGEWTGHGRASRKAAEKAWEQEFAVAERRGVLRVRDRLLALHDEHHRVVDGIEYLEWSIIAAALDEEVRVKAIDEIPAREESNLHDDH